MNAKLMFDEIVVYNLASYVVGELTQALVNCMKTVHNNVIAGSSFTGDNPNWDLNSESKLYIVICPSGLNLEKDIKYPKYYIPYQLEPAFKFEKFPLYHNIMNNAYNHGWDFSQLNIDNLGNNSIHVPIGYDSSVTKVFEYNESEKDIDVLFLGSWCDIPRRIQICAALNATVKCMFVCGENFDGMIDLIRRARICLDIRHDDKIENLASVRLNLLLSNCSCIIAEETPKDPGSDIYKDYVKFVNHKYMVYEILMLLKQPNEIKNRAEKSFRWYTNERKWTSIVDFRQLF